MAAVAGIKVQLEENALVKRAQNGEVRLECLFEDGLRIVEPSMITGVFEGTWKFKNGHARSCEVTELYAEQS